MYIRHNKITRSKWVRYLTARFLCVNCGRLGWYKSRRLNTRYHEDKLNYSLCCTDCHQDAYEYYEELWREYNAGR